MLCQESRGSENCYFSTALTQRSATLWIDFTANAGKSRGSIRPPGWASGGGFSSRAPSRCDLMIGMQREVEVLTAADQPKGVGNVFRLVMRHRVGQNKDT